MFALSDRLLFFKLGFTDLLSLWDMKFSVQSALLHFDNFLVDVYQINTRSCDSFSRQDSQS